jgi:hypothetical protein
MKEKLRQLLTVNWLTFGLIFGFYWLGLATATGAAFCLPFVVWFALWIWFADKPVK